MEDSNSVIQMVKAIPAIIQFALIGVIVQIFIWNSLGKTWSIIILMGSTLFDNFSTMIHFQPNLEGNPITVYLFDQFGKPIGVGIMVLLEFIVFVIAIPYFCQWYTSAHPDLTEKEKTPKVQKQYQLLINIVYFIIVFGARIGIHTYWGLLWFTRPITFT